MHKNKSYFFCGIGGSGMLPLANIVRDAGATVAGSDRALDQGRLGAKFEWLQSLGIDLFAQDGSGLISGDQILIASAAIEDSVPDVAKANALGCARMTRAELLADLFNNAPRSVAVGGTSGKSTVTGMIGWILTDAGLDPTIMNGAVMKNFVADDAPFASARVGQGNVFVSEVDESDGSIALFTPEVAVLNNVSLDHKSLEELRQLFGDFAKKAKTSVWNADDAETVALMEPLALAGAISFGFAAQADFRATDIVDLPLGSRFTLHAMGDTHDVALIVPGRHNIANALAAIAAATALGVTVAQAVRAIERFNGLARRFDIVGTANDITVIDDFGHNPDKIAATLATLKAFPGRIIAFFQPHGYGPIRVMGAELAGVFADMLGEGDHLILCDPVYFGGTVDKSIGSQSITDAVIAAGQNAEYIPSREDCGNRMVDLAQPGDRIVIMGARDDTLSAFAADILARLGA
ncbi:MAG: UDP-N-acetylmuramate--alanine ligase [Sphingomonadales bacterium 35-56-22]|jgi:UDP-N-acetylmuramate--alanine ligase|uniref:UDP-N-acetylmuramate--L-alanine ligase n=1 Tax=Sphingorhabdus sp. TaxID=1902408 RepID=UPI000BC7C16D|nr:Mur ligase family protein [Sphingorhabdus sp.]OYY15671.1 MAG: UDP-N-acetylmuramate--alanine ligase [Sphingomonadales bacterium 35-56-22]OYY98051.1 MAG: UDP-N-acetylmuramate--alanine ligase [Sphingomonadales bacterium 28-56-43]OYZ60534.1 MAG: UDP-N-acetylmuramate--alanine ligase [Sphingomonadales bacterium 24-56-14]OZA83008.1 MAG: UDP-N-acetylmuramate--alanine ligase [Sphingomonadales bacterium 39-57-19]HQS13209.1 Mur ligase family protein [Sphingorhabdus sp.]